MAWLRYLALVVAAGCGDNVKIDTSKPLGATVGVEVEVPADLAGPPFDQGKTLIVPPGFGIRVIARIPTARFIAETPEGDLLVSKPGSVDNADGQIFRIRYPHSDRVVTPIASGLATLPHGLVFADIGGVEYLYISQTDRVSRVVWDPNAEQLGTFEDVVTGLPSASLPELKGAYGHALKNIAIRGDSLYVSIASATNSDPSDVLADPVRGSIYIYNIDGGGGRLFAKGLRNAEGLNFHPRTGELWAAVNHRDNIRYPFHDNVYPFGALVQDYVNDHPSEPFTRIRDGGNYGWPYCNPTPDFGIDFPPYIPDIDNNDGETVLDCDSIDRINKALPAHAAPLGMSFWTGEHAPAAYRDGAVIAEHGCWNCSKAHGYEVVFLPLLDNNEFGDAQQLVTYFLPDLNADPILLDEAWGRPVDVIPNNSGNLYISDDRAGAVYELYRK